MLNQLLAECDDMTSEIDEDIESFMLNHERKISRMLANVEQKVENFGDELKELVELYVDVNEMMKDWKKTVSLERWAFEKIRFRLPIRTSL